MSGSTLVPKCLDIIRYMYKLIYSVNSVNWQFTDSLNFTIPSTRAPTLIPGVQIANVDLERLFTG